MESLREPQGRARSGVPLETPCAPQRTSNGTLTKMLSPPFEVIVTDPSLLNDQRDFVVRHWTEMNDLHVSTDWDAQREGGVFDVELVAALPAEYRVPHGRGSRLTHVLPGLRLAHHIMTLTSWRPRTRSLPSPPQASAPADCMCFPISEMAAPSVYPVRCRTRLAAIGLAIHQL